MQAAVERVRRQLLRSCNSFTSLLWNRGVAHPFSTTVNEQLAIPLRVGLEEAEKRFLEFHSQGLLCPGKAVLQDQHEWKQSMLPFWAFKGKFRIIFSAIVRDKVSNATKSLSWSAEESIILGSEDSAMQIYGGYMYRHDFINQLKPGEDVKNIRSFERIEGHHYEECLIPRYIAWDFVKGNILKLKEEQTKVNLQKNFPNHNIVAVKIRCLALPISSRIFYLPVYSVDYSYGKKINIHGERLPNDFYAVVRGTDGLVSSDKHISVEKAALYGGTLTASVLGITTALDPFVNFGFISSWTGYDYIFTSAGFAALSGMIAQVYPGISSQASDHNVATEYFEDVGSNSKRNCFLDMKDQEINRSQNEWNRWKQAENNSWDPIKRQRWAENLWLSHKNRMEAIRLEEKQTQDAENRRQQLEEREKRKQAKWGRQDPRMCQELGIMYERDRDYLGFYKSLGLNPLDAISQHQIKKQFQLMVHKWHPDRFQCAKDKEKAKSHFQQLMRAYNVLRHPPSRKKYDRGEWRPPLDH